jgi:hypothetical protein
MRCANFLQRDSKWASNTYAGGTMGNSGCGPTAAANVIYTKKSSVTPVEVATWLTNNGYATNGWGTTWGGIEKVIDSYGLECTMLNSSNLYGTKGSDSETKWKSTMKTGNYYGILLMGKSVFTTSGHYITIESYDGEYVDVHDPYSLNLTKKHLWSVFDGMVKVFYVIKKPTTRYYTKCGSSYTSIVAALNNIGVDGTFSTRSKIAKANGISSYTGSVDQNVKLLNLLKQGKLIKP